MDSPLDLDTLRQSPGRWRGCALTIGNYDGVHRGHQTLVRRVAEAARARAQTSVALTFSPHPSRFFRPDLAPFELTQPSQKGALLRHYGIDEHVIVQFDKKLSLLEPEEFVRDVLWHTFSPTVVVVGYDFAFGRGAKGTPELLRDALAEVGCVVHVVPAVKLGIGVVSTTRIRETLDAGAVEVARSLLGHPHALLGEVAHGEKRGRGLGFPTANVAAENERLPGNGVYVSLLETATARWQSVTSIGVRPTFGDFANVTIEAYVLDPAAPPSPDLYGQRVAVHLLARLRDELKFASSEALVAQMDRDVEATHAHFAADQLADYVAQLG